MCQRRYSGLAASALMEQGLLSPAEFDSNRAMILSRLPTDAAADRDRLGASIDTGGLDDDGEIVRIT